MGHYSLTIKTFHLCKKELIHEWLYYGENVIPQQIYCPCEGIVEKIKFKLILLVRK
jgi:hypothetical protein